MTDLNWQILPHSRSQLGESPFWHPLESLLYWVDIPGRQVCRANVFMGDVERWDLPEEPGCIAPAQSGGLVLALRSGVYRAPQWRGPLQLLARAPYDARTQRFNDGKCDRYGRLWVSTLYEPKDQALAQLLRLQWDAALGTFQWQVMAQNATTGNGLAWSPSGTTVYWADTPSHEVRAYDWSHQTLVRERVWAHFEPKPSGWQFGDSVGAHYGGRPDGAAVDQQGHYWVALFEGQRVCRFSPEGRLIASYSTPALRSTMVCFGGDDGQTLYLTTACKGQNAAEALDQPDAGHVYWARVPVAGPAVSFFQDVPANG
jgi:sugar lactone lactonase YvrE